MPWLKHWCIVTFRQRLADFALLRWAPSIYNNTPLLYIIKDFNMPLKQIITQKQHNVALSSLTILPKGLSKLFHILLNIIIHFNNIHNINATYADINRKGVISIVFYGSRGRMKQLLFSCKGDQGILPVMNVTILCIICIQINNGWKIDLLFLVIIYNSLSTVWLQRQFFVIILKL